MDKPNRLHVASGEFTECPYCGAGGAFRRREPCTDWCTVQRRPADWPRPALVVIRGGAS